MWLTKVSKNGRQFENIDFSNEGELKSSRNKNNLNSKN